VDTVLAGAMVSARTTAPRGQALTAEDFEQLVCLRQRRIFRLLLSLVRDEEAADNLTQECFLRAYRRRASFRGECRIETWLLRIAVNLALDFLRNRRRAFWARLLRLDDAEPDAAAWQAVDDCPGPERALLAREQAAAVWAAVATLSPQQQAVFTLRFGEEMSLAEIAEATQLELGTVKSHLHRALTAVRRQLRKGNRT
jgi:RNA polymerase sigma-70 factor (ECF subfamily)